MAEHLYASEPPDSAPGAAHGVRLAARPEEAARQPLQDVRGGEHWHGGRYEHRGIGCGQQEAGEDDQSPVRVAPEQAGSASLTPSWLTAEQAVRSPTAAGS